MNIIFHKLILISVLVNVSAIDYNYTKGQVSTQINSTL